MIPDNYRPLFFLKVFHSYFENDLCNCLQYTPSNDTQKLMKRYKLLLQLNQGGFECCAKTTQSIAEFLGYVMKTSKEQFLEFKIQSTDPQFYLFTEFPVTWTGQVDFSSSSDKNSGQVDEILLEGKLSEEQATLQIASLKIYFSDLLKLYNGNSAPRFKIQFKARATQWQYYIVNNSAILLNAPVITNTNGIRFEGPKEVTIPNGQQAILFSSGTSLIPLNEIPKHQFNLANKQPVNQVAISRSTTPKMVFSGLPNPNPDQIGIASLKGEKIVTSPMYVYV